MARLTTHVLDTSRGVPARGVRVEIHRIDGHARQWLAETATGADGRAEELFPSRAPLAAGRYELSFHVGNYFRESGVGLTDPPFFDVIVIQVGLADPVAHYHVPLLISPYGYSTYRGV